VRTATHRAAGVAGFVLVLLAACSKTEDGQLEVKVPEVDVKVRTDTVQAPNLPNVDVGTKRDTITTPTVGTKRTEIRRPTVETKRP
jgi:hypothetical protein